MKIRTPKFEIQTIHYCLPSVLAGPGRAAGKVAGGLGTAAGFSSSADGAVSGKGLGAGEETGVSPGPASGVAATGATGLASRFPAGSLVTWEDESPAGSLCPGGAQRPSPAHG